MRIALISDIHANLVALDAVLYDIGQQSVDSIVCLGDVATIGPQPREVLARLRELGCVCIMGNHESALLSPDQALDYKIAPSLLPALQWCARRLGGRDWDFLRSFIPAKRLPLAPDAELLCFHGSPVSNIDLITADTPDAEVDRMLAGRTAEAMAGGHSHLQMARQRGRTLLVNPGSVGCAFVRFPRAGEAPTLLPWAEYAIVNWSAGAAGVDLRRVQFGVAAFCEKLALSTVPTKEWWLEQHASASAGWRWTGATRPDGEPESAYLC